jgi:uncharacterized membrane protein
MKWNITVIVRSTVLGAILGAILCGLAHIIAAGGHGTGLIYMAVFPWSEVLYRMDLFHGERFWLVAIRWSEIPLYALFLSILWQLPKRWCVCGAVALVIFHMIAVGACFLPDRFFVEVW